jgi:hypothetical protein
VLNNLQIVTLLAAAFTAIKPNWVLLAIRSGDTPTSIRWCGYQSIIPIPTVVGNTTTRSANSMQLDTLTAATINLAGSSIASTYVTTAALNGAFTFGSTGTKTFQGAVVFESTGSAAFRSSNAIADGSIRLTPGTATGPSSIALHYRNDNAPAVDGDVWQIINGLTTQRNLSIRVRASGALTERLSITPAGLVTAFGGLVSANYVFNWDEVNFATTPTIPASVYHGRVTLSTSLVATTLPNFNINLPPIAAGAYFLLNLLPLGGYASTNTHANNYQVTLRAPGSHTRDYRVLGHSGGHDGDHKIDGSGVASPKRHIELAHQRRSRT